jgi:hypothetical protein
MRAPRPLMLLLSRSLSLPPPTSLQLQLLSLRFVLRKWPLLLYSVPFGSPLLVKLVFFLDVVTFVAANS